MRHANELIMGLDIEFGKNERRIKPHASSKTHASRKTTEPFKLQQNTSTPLIPYAHTVGRREQSRRFRLIALGLGLVILLATCLSPELLLSVLMRVFTGLIIVQALLRLCAVCLSKARFESKSPTLSFIHTDAGDWPLYTVLVPLKDEAHMVQGLMSTLSRLDYPRERLQIIFITEEDDPMTRKAVNAALHLPFEHVVVPRHGVTGPRTKPHALNIAMKYARGDIITIYDAEDVPHPEQLKTAIRAFVRHPKWGALQAPLDYFNTGESWLAAQFGLEYAAQFHVWIPLMVRLGLPFPLGGTSNHIRRSALETVRHKHMFWDSYNVTEDADLSFRLSAQGWDIGYITPPTQEEAVAKLKPWTHQRTRWMKGFMQSWRVHMDAPFAPGGWKGVRRQLTLQLTLGSVLLAGLFHAPICLALVVWIAVQLLSTGTIMLPTIVTMSLIFGYGSGILIAAVGAFRMGQPKLLLALPIMPLYWLCLAWPTYRAAVEYVRRPFYWAKTEHGVTTAKVSLSIPTVATKAENTNFSKAENANTLWPTKINPIKPASPIVSVSCPANIKTQKSVEQKDADG